MSDGNARMALTIETGAENVLLALREAGYDAYIVGGCVRDLLLSATPQDWDICTSASPDETMRVFGEDRCIPTGLKHGTITVKEGAALYEVTSFRTEGAYSDGRHPDSVTFVKNVCEDLSRRDFTINAMAYNAQDGLVDPFGGRADLRNGLVRAVGDAATRFEEDALRILRLYRFAARFSFAIDPETARAASLCGKRLSCVSVERIASELLKLLETKNPAPYLPQEILAQCILEAGLCGAEAYQRMLSRLARTPADAALRLSLILHDLGLTGEAAGSVIRRLHGSRALEQAISDLTRGMDIPAAEDALGARIQARHLLGSVGPARVSQLSRLRLSLGDSAFAQTTRAAQEIAARRECCSIGSLAVTGNDLCALGAKGSQVGQLLRALLEDVVCERLPNTRDALLRAARASLGTP